MTSLDILGYFHFFLFILFFLGMKNADLWPIILIISSPFLSPLFLSDGYDGFGPFFSSYHLLDNSYLATTSFLLFISLISAAFFSYSHSCITLSFILPDRQNLAVAVAVECHPPLFYQLSKFPNPPAFIFLRGCVSHVSTSSASPAPPLLLLDPP